MGQDNVAPEFSARIGNLRRICADLRVGAAYKSINSRVAPEVNCIYMRKRLITAPTPETVPPRGDGWLDLERTAVVELTSADKDYPLASALVSLEPYDW